LTDRELKYSLGFYLIKADTTQIAGLSLYELVSYSR
jgi:hypothetical protein